VYAARSQGLRSLRLMLQRSGHEIHDAGRPRAIHENQVETE
jgi:hypothetical protein